MCNDVSPLEANHFIVAQEGGVAVVPLAGLQNALKLSVIIHMPASGGAMLLMESIKRFNLRQQPALWLQAVHDKLLSK